MKKANEWKTAIRAIMRNERRHGTNHAQLISNIECAKFGGYPVHYDFG